jgi:hypothetical protein
MVVQACCLNNTSILVNNGAGDPGDCYRVACIGKIVESKQQ